ncbi:O-antigen ligase family protein [Patescibacteria group bacterium]|nr:O-antigen ligase family protein [Patescibacteria group bacterium]
MKINKILFIVLGVLVTALPLFLNTASDTEFTFNKTLLFQLGILIILVLLFFSNKLNIALLWSKYKTIASLLLLYLVVLVLTTIFSDSSFISFFGADRKQGLFQYLFYFSLIFIALAIITKMKQVYRLIYFVISGSILVSIVGIVEQLGYRVFDYTIFDKGIASTLGHPSFLGAYIVMTIPLTMALIFIISNKVMKLLFLFLLILQGFVVFFSQTRGAWISMIAMVVFIGIIVLIKYKKRKLLYSLLILLVIIVGLIVGTGLIQKVVDYQSGSGALRILWAEQASEAIKKSPLLGYGLDMQKDVLISYYDPLQGVYSYYNLFTDRIHNEFLDHAFTSGLIGLGTYLAILILTFTSAIRFFLKSNNSKESVIVLALITGIFAYIVQGMFSFSVTILYVYLWLYISLIFITIRLASNNKKEDVIVPVKNMSYVNYPISLVLIALIGITIMRPIIADGFLERMTNINLESRFAVYELKDIHSSILPYVNSSSGELPYRIRYVNLLLALAIMQDTDEEKTELFELCKNELDIIRQKNSLNLYYDLKMGDLMREWGKIDYSKFESMNYYYQQTIIKSPNYALLYYYWGRGLEVEGNLTEAKKQYLKAITLFADPDTFGIVDEMKKHLTLSIAAVFLRLSEVESTLGNIDIANTYHKKNQELIAPYLSPEIL